MNLDFSKRSDRKILERIIPPPSGGGDKFHYVRFQRVSIPFRFASGIIQLADITALRL